jgi:DNA polymerase III subunit delta
MDALDFLDQPVASPPLPLYVIHGDEPFLKRQVLSRLRDSILGDEDDAFALSRHAGPTATLGAVMADVDTLPFLSAHRLVIVEDADPFVTKYRAQMEKLLGRPAGAGVLILDVKSFAATTRLAKGLDQRASIQSKALTAQQLPGWCTRWMKQHHDKTISQQAARLLVELVGNDLGLLDQELAKLAAYAGEAKKVEFEDVDSLVGRSRMADVFKIFDAIAEGRTGDALKLLDRLFEQGEDGLRILGAFSYELRRLGGGYRLSQLGQPLHAALEEAGYHSFAVRRGEQLLRHIGRRRAECLFDWLLEADQGMKGGSALTQRQLLERFVVKLAAPLAAR